MPHKPRANQERPNDTAFIDRITADRAGGARMSIAILLADAQPIVRFGLTQLLARTDDLVVQAEAIDGSTLLKMVRERDWGLLVLDIALPGRGGLELIKLARVERSRLPILVFSACPETQYAVRAIRAGALGYLCKEADSALLLQAIRRVASGRVFVSQQVAELLVTDVSREGDTPPHKLLTNREFGIFSRIVRGDKLTQIADELSVSIKTISTHKSNILDKMTLSGQADLVRYAIEHKLLDTQA